MAANELKVNPATGAERQISYVPFGEQVAIVLTHDIVIKGIAHPTKKGVMPTAADVYRFMMTCRARGLNPWIDDAYLIGYDSDDGATFSTIVAAQALFKRAEANPQFDGIESGVIAMSGDKIEQLPGDFVPPGLTLVGGWARVHRKDRTVPFYEALDVKVYDKRNRQWNKDKAGMIVKCAECSVLRRAFANEVGGLYTADDIGSRRNDQGQDQTPSQPPRLVSDLAAGAKTPAVVNEAGIHAEDDEPNGGEPDDVEAILLPEADETATNWIRRLKRLVTTIDEKQSEFVRDLLESKVKEGFISVSQAAAVQAVNPHYAQTQDALD